MKSTLLKFYFVVSLLGLSLLIFITIKSPPELEKIGFGLLTSLCIMLQVILARKSSSRNIPLVNNIVLGAGLLLGFSITGWATVLGVFGGYLLYELWHDMPEKDVLSLLSMGYISGLHLLPLMFANLLLGYPTSFALASNRIEDIHRIVINVCIPYIGLHSGIGLIDLMIRGQVQRMKLLNFVMFASYELLPLPITLMLLSISKMSEALALLLGMITLFGISIFSYEKQRMHYASTSDEDHLSNILNSLEEGILFIETNGQIIYANDSMYSILGISEESILGRFLSELPINTLVCLGLTREDAESLIRHLKQNDLSFIERFESVFNNPIKRQTLRRKILPIRYRTNQPRGLLLVLYDVAKEQQIAQARDIFSETIIHDLRSPISATLGSLDVLQDIIEREGHNELAQQALRIARNSAKRVLNLVESMLDVIRMQSGKLNLNPTLVDLYALIEQIILDFKHQSQQYGITLRNEVSQGLPNVNVDQGKLQRVMINLVENALKFTPSGGEVVVKTEMANSGIIVHVEDSGPGIPDEYREKIFERFVQVPDQLGRQRGIGLGLTFCRLTIEAHGGKIWVDSRPGGGSVFSFFLPLD